MKKYTDVELKEMIDKHLSCIYERTEKGYLQRDFSSEEEKKIVFNCIFAALLTINHGEASYPAISTAEYMGDLMLPYMNGYLTIFQKINEILAYYFV